MRAWLVAIALAVGTAPAAPQVYKWVDDEGRIHYGDGASIGSTPRSEMQVDEGNIADPYTPARSPATVVKLFSTSWCTICRQAKAYLTRRGVRYTEYDVESDRLAFQEFTKLGGRGVPLLVIGGQRLQGFDRERVEQALDAAGL